MKLSVIIVSYNVKFYLAQCVRSLLKALENVDSEIFVVDNNSSDGSVGYIRSLYNDVKVISSSLNLGFAKANNVAINRCSGEYVLLLNPDTIIGEETIHDVLDFMDEHKNAGGAAVRMLKSDGTDAMESRRGVPTPMTAFYKVSGLCSRFPDNPRLAHYYMGNIPWNEPSRIEVVSGAFFFLRHDALVKVGLLDEDFFMYGEDIDLSYRLLKNGYENWYFPAKILHYKGESTEKTSYRYVHIFYNAMLIFFRKHYGGASLFISVPVKLAIYFKAFSSLLKMEIGGMRKHLGFTSANSHKVPPLYLFVGSREAIEYLNMLAMNNDLRHKSLVCDDLSVNETDLSFDISGEDNVYIVYDTDSFSYSAILKRLSEHPLQNMSLGTFDMKSKIIITVDGIIK